MDIERVPAEHDVEMMNLLQMLETVRRGEQAGMEFSEAMAEAGYDCSAGIHDLWSRYPKEKDRNRILTAAYGFFSARLEDRGLGEPEVRTPRTADLMEAVSEVCGLSEDWVEIHALAAFISQNRAATGQKHDDISNDLVAGSLFTVDEDGARTLGQYVRPRLESYTEQLTADPVVHCLNNLIANEFDALVPGREIGMFGSGPKPLIDLIGQTGEVVVASRTGKDTPGLLRMRKGYDGNTYLSVTDMPADFRELPLPKKHGTAVDVRIHLTDDQIRHALSNLSFPDGMIGSSVRLRINGRIRTAGQIEHWGKRRDDTAGGIIDVELDHRGFRVYGHGSGMDKAALWRLFIPRQGTKTPQPLTQEECRRAVMDHGYVDTEMTDSRREIFFCRRGEVLFRHVFPENKQSAGTVRGFTKVELDMALSPAGEGREQSGISPDANFPAAIGILTDKIIREKRPPQKTLAVLNTLYDGISAMVPGSRINRPAMPTLTERMITLAKYEMKTRVKAYLAALPQDTVFLPDREQFSRLLVLHKKKTFFVQPELLDFSGFLKPESLGERIGLDDGVETKSGYRVFTTPLLYKTTVDWDQAFDGTSDLYRDILADPEAVLPVLSDQTLKIIFVDTAVWKQYMEMARHEYDTGVPERTRVRIRFIRQCLESLMNRQADLGPRDDPMEVFSRHDSSNVLVKLQPIYLSRPGSWMRRTPDIPAPEDTVRRLLNESGSAPASGRDTKAAAEEPEPPASGLKVWEQSILTDYLNRADSFKTDEIINPDTIRRITVDNTPYICAISNSTVAFYRIGRGGKFRYIPADLPQADGERLCVTVTDPETNPQLVMVFPQRHEIRLFDVRNIVRGTPAAETVISLPDGEELPNSGIVAYRQDTHLYVVLTGIAEEQTIFHIDTATHEVRELPLSTEDFGPFPHLFDYHLSETAEGVRLSFVRASNWHSDERSIHEYDLQPDTIRPINESDPDTFATNKYVHNTRSLRRGNTDYLAAMLGGGIVDIWQRSADGSLVRTDSLQLSGEDMSRIEIIDDYGPYILYQDMQNSRLGVVIFDQATGEIQNHAFLTVGRHNFENRYSSLEHAAFLPVGDSVRIAYILNHAYGYAELTPQGLVRKPAESRPEREAVVSQFLSLHRHPELTHVDEQEFNRFMNMIFTGDEPVRDQADMLAALERVLNTRVLSTLLTPEFTAYLHGLDAKDSDELVEYFLYRFIHLFREGPVPGTRAQLEYTLVDKFGGSERLASVFALLETLDPEHALPMVEDRMKLYEVIHFLSPDYIHEPFDTTEMGKRLAVLMDMGVFHEVVGSLYQNVYNFGHVHKFDKAVRQRIQEQPYARYLQGHGEFVREKPETLNFRSNRSVPVSTLAYLSKDLGLRTQADMELYVQKEYKQSLENFSAAIDGSEFDADWKIAAHYSGVFGIEAREAIQNGTDAIRRRMIMYGDINTGEIGIDFYIQKINGERYAVREIADNGTGITEEAFISFVVSDLTDKADRETEAGQFGRAVATYCRDADLLIADSIRIIDEDTGAKGFVRRAYRVERDGRDSAIRLILIHESRNDAISQDASTGTTVRICKKAARGSIDTDALLSQNAVWKYGGLISATSKQEPVMNSTLFVPIDIIETVRTGSGDIRQQVMELGYTRYGTVPMPGGSTLSVYEGQGSLPEQVALDGKYLAPLDDRWLPYVHPMLFPLIEKYNLVVNLAGLTPTMDRANVFGEHVPVALSAILTRFGSLKMHVDKKHYSPDVSLDFLYNPAYNAAMDDISYRMASIIARMFNLNEDLTTEAAELIREFPDDLFHYLLLGIEHEKDGKRVSGLLERLTTFIDYFTAELPKADTTLKALYQYRLAQSLALVDIIFPDKRREIYRTYPYLEAFIHDHYETVKAKVKNTLQDVTGDWSDDERYIMAYQLCSLVGVQWVRIIRNLREQGFNLRGEVALNEELFITGGLEYTFLEEAAHEVEKRLAEAGLNTIFSHQEQGVHFTAKRITAYLFLMWLMEEKAE